MALPGILSKFSVYTLIGVGNTAVHWAVFGLLHALLSWSQAASNTAAFLVAVTVSYFLNARFTFKARPKGMGYLLFVAFMGFLSWGAGRLGDHLELPALATLAGFSALSLVVGFLWSHWVVFRKS